LATCISKHIRAEPLKKITRHLEEQPFQEISLLTFKLSVFFAFGNNPYRPMLKTIEIKSGPGPTGPKDGNSFQI